MRTSRVIREHLTFIVAAVVLAVVAAVLGRDGEGSTAAGVLCGGALALGVLLWLRRRAVRRGGEAQVVDRVAAGRGDERDRAVLQGAYAFAGVGGLLVVTAASVAVALGLDAGTVVSALPVVLLLLVGVGFVVTDRRI